MQAQSTTTWRPALEEAGPETGTIPGGIYDRPSEDGGYTYSQETHFNNVRALFHQNGIYVADYYYDEGSGGNPNRKEYLRLQRDVKQGRIHALGVDGMARLSRDGPDRLRLIADLRRLDVPIWRADKKCVDQGGIVSYVEAWQDEQYLYEQARKTVDNLPAAIRAGKHVGRTNIGYKREYRYLGEGRERVESVMVRDEPYARLVQQIYSQYDQGVPVSAIVAALNDQALPNPYSKRGSWSRETVYSILHCRVYVGDVEWGKTHPGKYGRYQGAPLVEKGQHDGFIQRALWERVQRRLAGNTMIRSGTRRERPAPLLDGLLRCGRCGAAMYIQYPGRGGGRYTNYICSARHRGISDCLEPRISTRVAEQAVLSQVLRLRGQPWNGAALDAALQKDSNEALRRRLGAQLADLEDQLQANAALVAAARDISPEAVEAFRKNALPLSLKIRHIKDQLGALPEKHADPLKAKETYDQLMGRDLASFVCKATADQERQTLREILLATVRSARIVERASTSERATRTGWARAAVEWSDEVELLREAGRLVLADDAERPQPTTARDLMRERMRRYRARLKERKAQA